jgi:peptide/nickel transport system permease protein
VALYLAQRALVLVTMLFGLVCITFVVSNVAPGDPAALAAGPNATRSMVETMRKEFGLDRPLPEQFVRYVAGILRGDFGRSISTGKSVTELIASHLPNTIELVLTAMTIGAFGGVALGVAAAAWRDRPIDHAIRIFTVSGVAAPTFWLAILLQLFFAVKLGWLPVTGRLGLVTEKPPPITHLLLVDSVLRGYWGAAREALAHLVLPAIVLAFPCLASITRVARAEMIETLSTDYVLSARAQGLGAFSVQIKHALRNAMLPILALIGLRYGWMLGGTVLVETVFDWPGLGLLAVNSALLGDFKPVIGVTLIIGLNVMLCNFLIDLAYAWLDPRLRTA